MDPTNIPKFPVLTNMTAVVQEPPKVTNDDVIMVVTMTDYVDQDNIMITIDCYYLASASHLTRMTPVIKKNSVLYISGEFILHNSKNYVHIKNMSFTDIQKLLLNTNISTQVPWKTEQPNPNTMAETLATKFNHSTENKKSPPVIKGSSVIKSSSKDSKPYTRIISRKLSDLSKEALTNSNECEPDASSSTSTDIQPK
ncbi:16487_t:CDS:1 [Cetraspora pellucida]|uniref:16487_t:CDS:1 n=1 Tax=Cetraspora pellucida TaxID=1433469 RepID=A0ACA9K8U1_9GLOM|nr:16487_t:CDS:1 [Cetraspora pellucida]